MMTGNASDTGSPRSALISDIGRVRKENQDAVLADDELRLWLVADGMGGHAGGARASALARDMLREQVKRGVDLPDAVMTAHHAVREAQRVQPEFGDMGTTVVAARETGDLCHICWVGDSRAYSFSAASGLELLTDDHNVAGMLVASGALSPTEAARHPQRHVLTDCLGLSGDDEPRVGRLERRWRNDELLLLCSDGLTGEVSESEIADLLGQGEKLEVMAGRLLDAALEAGAHDNVSLVLVASPQMKSPKSPWKWLFGKRRSRDSARGNGA